MIFHDLLPLSDIIHTARASKGNIPQQSGIRAELISSTIKNLEVTVPGDWPRIGACLQVLGPSTLLEATRGGVCRSGP